jgi:hypothetical protein
MIANNPSRASDIDKSKTQPVSGLQALHRERADPNDTPPDEAERVSIARRPEGFLC